MTFDCNIIANNNTDFVIADNIKSGEAPILIASSDGYAFVHSITFDIDKCRNNDLFRAKLKVCQENIKNSTSIENKFEIMQEFINNVAPICKLKDQDTRIVDLFDGASLSAMLEHKLCMCTERALLAQYLCQESGIKSYFINSTVQIKNGENEERGLHSFIIFENNNKMFVYDPANPTKNNTARIMSAGMDKTIFTDFIKAINYNADSQDKKQKNRVGFRCTHEDGKMFLYCSQCGISGTGLTPIHLRKIRLAKHPRLEQGIERK